MELYASIGRKMTSSKTHSDKIVSDIGQPVNAGRGTLPLYIVFWLVGNFPAGSSTEVNEMYHKAVEFGSSENRIVSRDTFNAAVEHLIRYGYAKMVDNKVLICGAGSALDKFDIR